LDTGDAINGINVPSAQDWTPTAVNAVTSTLTTCSNALITAKEFAIPNLASNVIEVSGT
jgi:hypothetical protein